MPDDFELHPRLAADCHVLGSVAEGVVLLHRNASLPWFILVPAVEAEQLIELPQDQRRAVSERWQALATWVGQHFACDRVNLGAIGNMVSQLHLHAIGRRRDDPAWPGVVWGFDLPASTWSETQLDELRRALAEAIELDL